MDRRINQTNRRIKSTIATAFVLATLLASCSNRIKEEAIEIDTLEAFKETVNAWEQVVGEIPYEQYQSVKSIPVVFVDELPSNCVPKSLPKGNIVVGCHLEKNAQIYVLDTGEELQMRDTLHHEYIHAISYYMFGDADEEHSNPALWEHDSDLNNVEIWANAS